MNSFLSLPGIRDLLPDIVFLLDFETIQRHREYIQELKVPAPFPNVADVQEGGEKEGILSSARFWKCYFHIRIYKRKSTLKMWAFAFLFRTEKGEITWEKISERVLTILETNDHPKIGELVLLLGDYEKVSSFDYSGDTKHIYECPMKYNYVDIFDLFVSRGYPLNHLINFPPLMETRSQGRIYRYFLKNKANVPSWAIKRVLYVRLLHHQLNAKDGSISIVGIPTPADKLLTLQKNLLPFLNGKYKSYYDFLLAADAGDFDKVKTLREIHRGSKKNRLLTSALVLAINNQNHVVVDFLFDEIKAFATNLNSSIAKILLYISAKLKTSSMH